MIVYVVEKGYESEHIVGVYATVEAAMIDNPLPKIKSADWKENDKYPGHWWNGLYDHDACSITPYEVKG